MENQAKKGRFLSLRLMLPLTTAGVLVIGFVIYYFVVITTKESQLDNRAFRSLAAVAQQFRESVSNYGIVLQGATRAETGETARSRAQPAGAPVVKDAGIHPKQQLTMKNPDILGFLASQGSEIADLDHCQSSPNAALGEARGRQTGTTVDVAMRATGYNLELASNGWCAHIPFETTLSRLIATGLPENFDDVALADRHGNVLFQTNHSGVVLENLASLPVELVHGSWVVGGLMSEAKRSGKSDEGSKSSGTGSTGSKHVEDSANASNSAHPDSSQERVSGLGDTSNVFMVSLAGSEYRLYVVPVILSLPQASPGQATHGLQLILCGLLLQKHFTTQSRSLPLTVLTAILLAVLLVIVGAWPILKFSTMRRSEPVPARAGVFYATSMAFMIVVMNLLVIHLKYGFSDPKTKANMADLAKAIDANVGAELKEILAVMESMGGSSKVREAPYHDHVGDQPCTDASDGTNPSTQTNLLSALGIELVRYPYFRRVYVYDGQGFEQVRWSVDAKAPPSLRVCDRPYFQGVQRNDLWYLTDVGLSGPRFRVDPIYSKSTGEYLAAIAQPYKIVKAPSSSNTGVLLLVSSMLSLINPVLPPDYGFAVIDESGKVLFHSDATRNGRENFFDELSDSRELRATISVKRRRWLTQTYLGHESALFVTPFTSIQGCPWSLLIFSSRDVLGEKALEQTVLTIMLSAMYLILLMGIAWLLSHLFSCRNLLWPSAKMRGAYCQIALCVTLMVLLSFVLFFESSPKEILCFALFVPACMIAVCLLRMANRLLAIQWIAGLLGGLTLAKLLFVKCVRGLDVSQSPYLALLFICLALFGIGVKSLAMPFERWRRPAVSTGYSLACFTVMVLVAGTPCIGFFRFAYDYNENLDARRKQVLTLVALSRREQRVIQQYFQVKLSAEQTAFADDLGKWLFLRRRLQEEKRDLYDKAFRDQAGGEVIDEDNAGRWPIWWVHFVRDVVPTRPGSFGPLVADDCTARSQWRWKEAGINRIHIQPSLKRDRVSATSDLCKDNPGGDEVEDVPQHLSLEPPTNESLKDSPETSALRQLALGDPMFLSEDLTYRLDTLKPWSFIAVTGLYFLVLLSGIFWSMRSTLTKMFLLTWKEPEVWDYTTLPLAIRRAGRLILVGLPRSGKTESLDSLRKGVGIIDVAIASKSRTSVDVPTDSTIVLDHFEYRMSNRTIMSWKLNLLRRLIELKKNILIVSTVDPVFYIKSWTEEPWRSERVVLRSAQLEEWNWVLNHFTILRLDPTARVECTGYFFELLWASCTWGEKITLASLAGHGWPNHKNHQALQHLLNRGLIVASPEVRLSDPLFADYISGTATETERLSWRRRDKSGNWDALRTALIILALGALATILFLSQKDILGIISGVAGALTAATKVVSDVRSSRPATAREGRVSG